MIPLQESAGDKTLYKIIIYKIPLIQGVDEDMYDDTLKAYLYIEPYTYNTLTRETDDRLITHYDILRSIPAELRKHEDCLVYGKTDCYISRGNEQNPIRLCFWGNSGLLTPRDKTYLKRLTNADWVSKG